MNIAIVGKLGSGKSTVAGILVGKGYVHHSWAKPVRDIFSMAYDVITPENYSAVKQAAYPVMVDGHVVVRTGREILQRIGTDAMRDQVDQDFWITAGVRQLDALHVGPIVNDDTRFLNEAAALRRRGFVIVRITRPGYGHDATHASEVEQDSIPADRTIENDGDLYDLYYAVDELLR